MSLYLVLGGVRSGKSAFAEKLALQYADRGCDVYVAVFGNPHLDQEFAERIALHRAHRPAVFKTVEAYEDPLSAFDIPDDKVLVVDCLSTALSCCMKKGSDSQSAQEAFSCFVDGLLTREGPTIIVSSEIGLGFMPLEKSCRLFIDLLGEAHQRLATQSLRSWLVVAGRPVALEHTCESALEGLIPPS